MSSLTGYFTLLPGLALCVILGANNLSTCLGTAMGSRALRYRQAVPLASLGLLAGILLEGQKLSGTLTSQLVSATDPKFVLAVAVSTFTIMVFLTFRRIPISLSQVIVGAVLGAAFALGVPVNSTFTLIVAFSWLLTPISGLVAGFALSLAIRRIARQVRRILTMNALYSYLTIFTGLYASYTLGANTVGLVVGMFEASGVNPLLISVAFGIATVLGMVAFSRGTTLSVAENIVGLSPSASFAAQMGGALTVHGFTEVRVPVSVSQAVVGGIFGAAIPRNIVIRNDRLTREIILGWTVAPILGAALGFLVASLF